MCHRFGAVSGCLARLGTASELPLILADHPVEELVVASSRLTNEGLLQILDNALREGVKVRVAPKTAEILSDRARYIPGQAVPLFELRAPVFAGVDWVVKRGFDLIVAGSSLSLGYRYGRSSPWL